MKAVLFDLDDTLYPEIDFVKSGFRAVARYLAATYGANEDDAHQRMMAVLAEDGRGRIFQRLLEEMSLYTDERVRLLIYLYRIHEPVIRLYDDAVSMLEGLRGSGVRLGIVTDGMGAVQRRKIAALGLERSVDLIICTDEIGPDHWKPSATPFRVALEWLRVAAHECAYVGDDPPKDFVGANLLGMMTIQVCRGTRLGAPYDTRQDSCGARVTVGGLAQIMPLLEQDDRDAATSARRRSP